MGNQYRDAEKAYSHKIVVLVRSLRVKYDLCMDTAKKLSAGSKGFRPHKSMAKDAAKLGGAQRAGLVAIDRYTSYRIRNDKISLSAIVILNADPRDVKYVVAGPKRFFDQPILEKDLRPMSNSNSIPQIVSYGQSFNCFHEAKELYQELMSHIAPLR